MLKDQNYCQTITEVIANEISKHHSSQMLKWEMVKMAVRGKSIQYASEMSKKGETNYAYYIKQAKQLEVQIYKLNANDVTELEQKLIDVNKEIEEINHHKTMGSMIHCRVNWLEYSEKSSKYFFALEKHNYNKKNINRLKLENGNYTTDQKEILAEESRFFKQLYLSTYEERDPHYLNDLSHLPVVKDEHKIWMDRVIDLNEIETAVSIEK